MSALTDRLDAIELPSGLLERVMDLIGEVIDEETAGWTADVVAEFDLPDDDAPDAEVYLEDRFIDAIAAQLAGSAS